MQTFDLYMSIYAHNHHIPITLVSVLQTIVQSCIAINTKIRLGDLSGVLGEAATGNIQGEQQKKLDVIANSILVENLSHNLFVAGLVSEEEDTFITVHTDQEYLILFDPLDGSSNVDVNISIGTIFSILQKPAQESLTEQHFLQKGKNQVVAGYVLYGPQTILTLTFGHEVLMFTLNEKQEFIYIPQEIFISPVTQEFAVNMSNQRFWDEPMRQYVNILLLGQQGTKRKDFNMRWVASMVAEVHRILIRGGVFLYPNDSRPGMQSGKLRLLYEVNPMSLIINVAGGKASGMVSNILDMEPQTLHQRVPIALGASEEIESIEQLYVSFNKRDNLL